MRTLQAPSLVYSRTYAVTLTSLVTVGTNPTKSALLLQSWKNTMTIHCKVYSTENKILALASIYSPLLYKACSFIAQSAVFFHDSSNTLSLLQEVLLTFSKQFHVWQAKASVSDIQTWVICMHCEKFNFQLNKSMKLFTDFFTLSRTLSVLQ